MSDPTTLRVLFLGDVVGMPGVQAVRQAVPLLKERYRPHLIIANAENAANGTGLTPDLYRKLCEAGIDAMTLGDHVYKKQQILRTLEESDNLIRPANISEQAVGARWMRLHPHPEEPSHRLPPIYVMTVLGRIFMPNMPANDPFATVDHLLTRLPDTQPIVLVEIHAEASSEKQALGWHLNGRVAAVVGTHTHVPTADARILPSPQRTTGPGTAYITDLGMSGPYDSVLGRRVDAVLAHMTTNMYAAFDVATDNTQVCGVMLEIDIASRLCSKVEAFVLPITL